MTRTDQTRRMVLKLIKQMPNKIISIEFSLKKLLVYLCVNKKLFENCSFALSFLFNKNFTWFFFLTLHDVVHGRTILIWTEGSKILVDTDLN